MELETINPAHGSFPPKGDLLERFVTVNTAIVADRPRGGVDEGKARRLTSAGVQIDAQRRRRGGNQRHEPVMAQPVGKPTPTVPTHMQQMEGFKVAVVGLMNSEAEWSWFRLSSTGLTVGASGFHPSEAGAARSAETSDRSHRHRKIALLSSWGGSWSRLVR